MIITKTVTINNLQFSLTFTAENKEAILDGPNPTSASYSHSWVGDNYLVFENITRRVQLEFEDQLNYEMNCLKKEAAFISKRLKE